MPDLATKNICNGCSACVNVCPKKCITMVPDKLGFLYPEVDDGACVSCGACEKACSALTPRKESSISAYAAYNANSDIRKKSSSGGVFSLIASKVIKDGGVVFGAGFDENFKVIHKKAETLDEIEEFRGSKYSQSDKSNVFYQVKALLFAGREVLFSGTPCEVAGLKEFLGREYDSLICIDTFCHGVPSPRVYEEYLKKETDGEKLVSLSFRDKTYGWQDYGMRFTFENGKSKFVPKAVNPYLQGFIRNLYLRHSCYECNFKGIENFRGDITLGDFWGVKNVLPDMDSSIGVSAVICHNDKAERIVKELFDDLVLAKVDVNDILKYNKAVVQNAKKNQGRDEFVRLFSENPEKAISRIESLSGIGTVERIKRHLKSIGKK